MKVIQKQWAVNHIEYMADRRLFKKCQRRLKRPKGKRAHKLLKVLINGNRGGKIEKVVLILRGICMRCGDPVARVIENE